MGVPVVHSGRIVVINHAKRDWGGMVTREKTLITVFCFLNADRHIPVLSVVALVYLYTLVLNKDHLVQTF